MPDERYALTAANFLRTFPEALRDGGILSALGETIAAALERGYRDTIEASLYPRIGELSGDVLDLLAAELRTPFYDPAYDIEAKRDLIRQTMPYYRTIGTRGACQRMLGAVFPGSYLEEWYEYGGEPLRFRIIVELARSRGTVDSGQIRRVVDRCKRLSAHLEALICQWDVGIVIGSRERGYRYAVPMTGQRTAICGTWPRRSIQARLAGTAISAGTGSEAYHYQTPMTGQAVAGTVPGRTTEAGIRPGASRVTVESTAYHYHVPRCGTRRCRS